MSRYVVRHGLSTANDRNNIGTPAYGHNQAELMEDGIKSAKSLKDLFLHRFAITTADTPVATSIYRRTGQTAEVAGFTDIHRYKILNEVPREGLGHTNLREELEAGRVPRIAIDCAELVLENPPPEKVWITHALLIVGMCAVLGTDQDYERLLPQFCEVRFLPIEGSV